MSDATFPESWPEDSMNHIPSRNYRRRQHDAARATYSDGRADRPTTEPRTEDVDADECGHMALTRWTGGPGVDDIWACSDCRRRFYPACPECVTVGHRDGHPARATPPAVPDVLRLLLADVARLEPHMGHGAVRLIEVIELIRAARRAALTGGPSDE